MAREPLRVGCIGMGWWSDVLADAMKRSNQFEIAACYTRSDEKRKAFASKYGCKPAASYDDILNDRGIDAVINTTPPHTVPGEAPPAPPKPGRHVFLEKPIANTIADGRAITEACRKARVVL